MTWQKKFRWVRTWGDETGIDGKPHEDYQGFDGEVSIGRIYLDQQPLKAGKWFWAIQYPKGAKPWLPNSGWVPTAADAARMVEETWDRQKERAENG
ncbi:hypothetical protein GGQ64_005320 [Rhizobium azooxidifex]|uniref:Uncharacterized protein n=1 Tax=Mycoplana azooxidifex TaxID=1636188 RepID=A0A7W6GMA7_9HYPH|nr:hypothetical protein [Mycoplana azooxidifex]MBB3980073.1 hypothetical protein [Mycoplana azooxidifex]